MGRGHPGLPQQIEPAVIRKADLLRSLKRLDDDQDCRDRVQRMELEFRRRIEGHVRSLPLADATFAKFKTNPFVLLFHALRQGYRHVHQIEQDILPAKLFSSMETSAGKMVEQVVRPVYGWTDAPSVMHSPNSVLDAMQVRSDVLRLATLKSGPVCLNDEMSKDIGSDIAANCVAWARTAGVKKVDFTYGVLYGTKRMSNKKDWHVLRNLVERLPSDAVVTVSPAGRWDCAFCRDGVEVEVAVRIGIELWNHLAESDLAFLEILTALIRACVPVGPVPTANASFTIRDLAAIVSLAGVPDDYNLGLLQRSQWEWVFFIARHFCDQMTD